jgi:hypothetical protein
MTGAVRLRYAGECGVVNEGGCDDESGAVALAESVGTDCDAAPGESPAIPWIRLYQPAELLTL